MLELYASHKGIAGSYDEDWQGNYRFICITGHAQLVVFFMRLYEITKQVKFKEMAEVLFGEISNAPYSGWNRTNTGGIAGSIPVYASYNPLRYPNWAAKFYIDAWWYIKRVREV